MKRLRLRVFASVGLVGLSLSLTSCRGIESKSPLSDPDHSKPDERLYGHWMSVDKDNKKKPVHLFIGLVGRPPTNCPPSIMRAYLIGLDEKKTLDLVEGWMFATALGGDSYVNVFDHRVFDAKLQPQWEKTKIEVFTFYHYAISDEDLTIRNLKKAPAMSAVKRGVLKGEIIKDDNGNEIAVRLTDTTENVRRFIQDGSKSLLEEPLFVFRRVR